MDKITKFSQAIRIGASRTKQCFYQLFQFNHSTGFKSSVEASCAIGAVHVALSTENIMGSEAGYKVIANRFPNVFGRDGIRVCPGCNARYSNLIGIVAHLNDSHKWTREEIADWLGKQGE